MAREANGPDAGQRRAGEIALERDPAEMTPQAGLLFIGRVRSPWTSREDCPKNMKAAAAVGGGATLEIEAAFRPGLAGLERFSHAVVVTWLDRSRRDLVVQVPRHATAPRGVFALRSPVRPNPLGLHVVEIAGIEPEAGIVRLAAIDVLDGTPIVDLKPYFASTDSVPDARGGER